MKSLYVAIEFLALTGQAHAGLLCAVTQDPQVCAVGQALRGVGAAMQQAAPPPAAPVAPANTRCNTTCYNRAGQLQCQQTCN